MKGATVRQFLVSTDRELASSATRLFSAMMWKTGKGVERIAIVNIAVAIIHGRCGCSSLICIPLLSRPSEGHSQHFSERFLLRE